MSQHPVARASELGPITDAARWFFQSLKWLSPMPWLSWRWPVLKARSLITPEEARSDGFIKRRGRAVDTYILGWLGIELLLTLALCFGTLSVWPRVVFAIVGILRIVEIMQITVNATVFDEMSGRPDNSVASHARMITIAGLNYAELIICFGVIYAANLHNVIGATRGVSAFYFSAMTQLTIGYGDLHPANWLRLAATAQGLAGLTFVVLVVARLVASMTPIIDAPHGGGTAARDDRAGNPAKVTKEETPQATKPVT